MKVKKGDNVIVISGAYKGKKGKITKVFPAEGKIIVEGVNIRKRHRKPRTGKEKGQIIEIEGPLYASKVKLASEK